MALLLLDVGIFQELTGASFPSDLGLRWGRALAGAESKEGCLEAEAVAVPLGAVECTWVFSVVKL